MPAKKPAKKQGPARARNLRPTAGAEAVPKKASELQAVLSKLTEVHGVGIVVRGDVPVPANHSPTGAFSVDMALCGGFAEGYASMVYGRESSGKTLLALLGIAGYQRKHPNGIAVFVDAEKLFDPAWAEKLGVNMKRLYVITPDTGEQAVDAFKAMMDAEEVGFAVMDSLPACVPQAVEIRSSEDKTMGALAALLGVLCSKIIVSWGRERRRGHRCTVVLLNQKRMKIGGHVKPGMPPPESLPGGRQINHLPTTKVSMTGKQERTAKKKGEQGAITNEDGSEMEIEQGGKDTVVRSTELNFRLEKFKHGASITMGAFNMILANGHESGLPPGSVDDCGSVAVYAFKHGLARGGGGNYRLPYFTEEVFRKKEDVVTWLRKNPAKSALLRATLIAAMRQRHGLKPFPPDDSLEGIQHVSMKIPEGALETALGAATVAGEDAAE